MSLKFRIHQPITMVWVTRSPNQKERRKLSRKNSSLRGELGRVLGILAR